VFELSNRFWEDLDKLINFLDDFGPFSTEMQLKGKEAFTVQTEMERILYTSELTDLIIKKEHRWI